MDVLDVEPGMEKLLLFSSYSQNGVPNMFIIDTEGEHLVKQASDYHPEIAEYIRNAKKIPGITQILLTALGAGEYWGDNKNGDYFPESEIAHNGHDYGFKTFESMAKIYKHHINKDPKKGYGHVALAVYNNQFHRVELIVHLDNAKAPDIAERHANGEHCDWSMGTRVPYDICSICGNKASTPKKYCHHLKYLIGRIDPTTGKKVYAINIKPKFFDISLVLIGADSTAKTLLKVASYGQTVYSSALLAEKMAAAYKQGEMDKRIESGDAPSSCDVVDDFLGAMTELSEREKSIPNDVIDRISSGNSLSQILSTISAMGILPKPQEFQRIILVNMGHRTLADSLESKNMCFDPLHCEDSPVHQKLFNINPSFYSPSIFNELEGMIPDRSGFQPHIGRRVIIMASAPSEKPPIQLVKIAEDNDVRSPIPLPILLGILAGAFSLYSKKLPGMATEGISKLIANHPALSMAIGAGVPLIASSMMNSGGPKGTQPANMNYSKEIISPQEYMDDIKQNKLLKVANISINNINRGVLGAAVGVPALYWMSGRLQKHRQTDPEYREGKLKNFIRQYPDFASAVLAMDAFQTARGGHSAMNTAHGLIEAVKHHGKKVAPMFKMAEASETIQNVLMLPLIAGGKALPVRLAGSALDQATFHISKKLLSKNKNQNNINR